MKNNIFGKPLTSREVEIIDWLSYGHSNPEIAKMMNLSQDTVRTHVRNIGAKLGTHGRSGIVGAAFRKGILTVPTGQPGDSYGFVSALQPVRT